MINLKNMIKPNVLLLLVVGLFFHVSSLYADWVTQTVPSDLAVAGKFSSLAFDSNNRPHISYHQYNFYSDSWLKHAKWNGSSWIIDTIDSVDNASYVVGEYTSIAVEANNHIHISYYYEGAQDLKYAYYNGSSWSTQTVDSTGNTGLYTSIAVGSDGAVHISYKDETNGNLKYAKKTGSNWSITTIDSTGNVGAYTSLAVGSDNKVHISYYNSTNGDLKYARYSGGWEIFTVDSTGDVGKYSSLAVGSDNKVHIAYFDETNNNPKYAKGAGSNWSITSLAHSDNHGQYISIALDSSNNPHVSYYDATNDDLIYRKYSGSAWSGITRVDQTGDVGQHTSIANDNNDQARIAYFDNTSHDLKYAQWVPSLPYMTVNPASLSFNAVYYQGNPPNQTFSITNSGNSGIPINWTANSSHPTRMSFSPASGTIQSGQTVQVTVSANISQMPPQTINAAISINSTEASNSPQTVSVVLTTVSPPPSIGFNPSSGLVFSMVYGQSNPQNQIFQILNSGPSYSSLNWSASDNASWLSLTPASGGPLGSGSFTPVTLSVNSAGLSQGTYNAVITVTDPNASNSPQQFSVTFIISSVPRPSITVNPTEMDFSAVFNQANPSAQLFTITNTGDSGTTLNWTAGDDALWLSLSPASGSLETGAQGQVSASVDITGLSVGIHTAVIAVSDPNAVNNPQTISVTLTISEEGNPLPQIFVNPAELSFTALEGGSNPSDQIVTIINLGASGSMLEWTAGDDALWLSLSPASGSLATGAQDQISVSAGITGLAVGIHTAVITISDPDATNNPLTISVSLTVESLEPKIAVNSNHFNFTAVEGSSNPPDQSLVIGNTGPENTILIWTAVDNAEWLSLSPVSGSLSGGDPIGETESVNLAVDIAGLVPGIYHGIITISDDNAENSPLTVSVDLTIDSEVKPIIGISQSPLQFNAFAGGNNPADQTVVITNTGLAGSVLNWTSSFNESWLALSQTEGSLASDASTQVIISVEVNTLAEGTYTSEITISDANADNNPQSIEVILTVLSQPSITVVSPNGNEVISGEYEISWTTDGDWDNNKVNIYYVYSGYKRTIAYSTSNDGSYIWNTNNLNIEQCRIRIEKADDASVYDESDNSFTVDNSAETEPFDEFENNSLAQNIGDVKIQGGAKGYVNPSQGETAQIHLMASGPGNIDIRIYTINGQLVWETSAYTSGNTEEIIQWACSNTDNSLVSSGVYIIYIKCPGIDLTKKVAVLR
ncbi:MAG: T9SS type A sorting domain-containing protein [bacterium]